MSDNTAITNLPDEVIADIQQDARRWAEGGVRRVWPADHVRVRQESVWYDEFGLIQISGWQLPLFFSK